MRPGRTPRIPLAIAVPVALLAASALPRPVRAQDPDVVFLDVVAPEEGTPAPDADALPLYRIVDDPDRLTELRAWASNDAAQRALSLYRAALESRSESTRDVAQPADLYVALEPGGNHADVGFRLQTDDGVELHPRVAFVKLGPDAWRFGATLLHETGHVATALLAGGRRVARRDVAAIPHTTAALTDRGTAFAEGYAIHLETWLAHTTADAPLVRRYRHEQFLFGAWPGLLAEYYRPANDLLTFAQSYARYGSVADNHFAFAPAPLRGDYLRLQLDPGRDFATVRGPNQLLQSEGFYASFFFGLVVRGAEPPSAELIAERERRILSVLADVLPVHVEDPETPWLTRFVAAYGERYPEEGPEIVDVLLDLSHGVFVDPEAAARWRQFYLAGIRLDLEGLDREGTEAARERWRRSVAEDPSILESRLGPQVRCEATGVVVQLVAFGDPLPLVFDANTVEAGVLGLVPGITEAEVERWMAERERVPFAGPDDLTARGLPGPPAGSALACSDSDPEPS